MGKRGFRKSKDKFDSLTSNFKDAILQSSTDEIRKRVSEIAILDCTERAILKADPDIAQAKDKLKNLMDPVRENLRSYKLQIEFCKRTLDDKGVGGTVTKSEVTKIEKAAAESHARVDKAEAEFKNKVGDALEKALGPGKVQRNVTIKA